MGFNSGLSGMPDLKRRFVILSLFVAGFFLILIFRLWYLQVIHSERYSDLSEKNRTRYLPIAASRGPVFDRNGYLLVDSRPGFSVSVMRQDVDDRQHLLAKLSPALETDASTLERRWKEGRRVPIYRPLPLAEDVGRDILERVQENSVGLPGVLTEVRPIRSYLYPGMAAHVFGYLGDIEERELERLEKQGYNSGDYIGKNGVEKYLENYLRGVDGQLRVEVDVQGKALRQLRLKEPTPGKRVFLTLDRDLQLAAEEAFGDKAGAAVALDVITGEVLAMVSRPTFDPAMFARGIEGGEWLDLLTNPRHPLTNKAISGQYPPGSTFKIVTALAALKAGVAGPDTEVDCKGRFRLGRREFRCWKKKGHGKTDFKKALRESCDVWYYKVGLELGIDRLSEMAFALGLGHKSEFPLDGEKGGLIPTRQWKRKRLKEAWYDGETVNASIGQGFVLVTPLQLAMMTAAVANGGELLRPQVVKKVEDWDGGPLYTFKPQAARKIAFDPEQLALVQQGLMAVVNEPHGTGGASRLRDVKVAGKTGTAQVVRRKSDEEEEKQKEEDILYEHRDHALFVAYAPAEAPRIAVAVIVEHGGHGGSAAAPIARSMLKEYFSNPSIKSPVAKEN